MFRMLEHVQYWYMIVPKIKAIALYCQLLSSLAVHVMTCSTLFLFASHAAQTCCISLIWAQRIYSRSKLNICAKVKDRALLLKWAQSLKANQLYCLAPIMVHRYFYVTKDRVTYFYGIPRPALNRPISWKYKKGAIAVYPHRLYRAPRDICGHLKVISMTTLQIPWAVMALQLYCIQWFANVTIKHTTNKHLF